MSSTGAVGTDRQYDATMQAMHREDQSGSLNRLRQTLSSRGNTLTTKWKTFLAPNSPTQCLMNDTVNSNSCRLHPYFCVVFPPILSVSFNHTALSPCRGLPATSGITFTHAHFVYRFND